LLLIFPEKKYLEKILEEVISNHDFQSALKDKINIHMYAGDTNKKSKEAVWNLINFNNDTKKLKIVFTTRVGLFLPFVNLNNIVLVDESNSMYIQDQNSVYFDTRVAAFLLAQAYQAKLTFLSSLPSIRLYNFYPKNVIKQLQI
ncbi:MAG: hypothetical protein AAGF07_02090, partial [Patescibacteria group bacterium]